MNDAHRRLDDLKATARPARRPATTARPGVALRLEDVLGGFETVCRGRRCWLVETSLEALRVAHRVTPDRLAVPLHHALGTHAPAVLEPRRTLVLDIETGGFSGAPVFLIGVVPLGRRPLRVVQWLARDYPEEDGILRAFAALAEAHDTWVTFNGKSFDEPFLHDRATVHHVPLPPPALHVDLLHAARRQWRASLPNCRLVTLEQEILGRQRVGDVPSSDVPDLFHHFIRTGNPAPLGPVLEHNRLDLVACTELLLRLSAQAVDRPRRA